MRRFDRLFSQLASQNQTAFVPFVTLGDPDFDRSFEIVRTLVESGADALELGFPFSDPLLDGEVIQAANKRALDAGCSTRESFALLTKIRATYPEIPISLLLCANLVYVQGIDFFYQRCAEAGVDAVLIADLPHFAADEFAPFAEKHGIQTVYICPPNADEQTIKQIAKASQGYLYLVSRAGVTGAENQSVASNLASLVQQLKRYDSSPILQGFGISSPEQVRRSAEMGIEGAISGSAVTKIIAQYVSDQPACLTALRAFVTQMKQATLR